MIAGVLCLTCAAQQPAPTAAQAPRLADQIASAQARLQAAETAHPGNSREVAAALDELIQLQRDNGTGDEKTLDQARRLLQMQTALAGPRSKEAVDAMETETDLLEALNHVAEARALAGQALEIAQKEFPQSEQTSSAADSLGRIC
ncbi:MAG TPA: hypothetical protein VMD29_03235, partial [Terracidiphilus sp.]|nr:hypothetical protein [Terracidiphilus sp.]